MEHVHTGAEQPVQKYTDVITHQIMSKLAREAPMGISSKYHHPPTVGKESDNGLSPRISRIMTSQTDLCIAKIYGNE